MDTKKLRQKILDLAIHGKLVPQDPNDEPASVLLERIRAEKELMIKEGKIKKSKKVSKSSDTPHYEQVPFEVPEGWVWTTLGNIGTWQAGGTPNRSNKEYYGGNIPWLKTGDLNDSFIISIPESITEEAVSKSSAKLNPKGSVLMAMYGATIGKLGILTFPAATNQACCACIQYDAVVQMYLFYYLMSQRSSFIEKGGGGAQPNISKEIIINTAIPVPPLSEQSRIVSQIDYWFSIIEKIESAKVNLKTCIDQTKNKILTLAIHGKLVPQDPNDEPAIELLKRVNPNFTPCDNAHYPQLPSGWAYSRLGDICKLKNGYAFKSGLYSTQGVRIIRIANVQDGYIEDDAPQYYDFDKMKGLDSFLLSDGDLLMSLTGNVGRVCFITKKFLPAALNQRVACVRNNEVPINKEYLFHLFQSEKFVKDCKNSGKGVAQQNISTEWLKEYIVPLPPLLEQDRIVTLIKGIYSYLDTIMDGL